MNFQGKEGAEGTKSTGEASSIGERTHGEKANCRHAEAHADTGPSAGPSTCNSHALVGILSFCRQILSLISPCKSTVLLSCFLFGFFISIFCCFYLQVPATPDISERQLRACSTKFDGASVLKVFASVDP